MSICFLFSEPLRSLVWKSHTLVFPVFTRVALPTTSCQYSSRLCRRFSLLAAGPLVRGSCFTDLISWLGMCPVSCRKQNPRSTKFNSCIHLFKNNNACRASYVKNLLYTCFKAKVHWISKIKLVETLAGVYALSKLMVPKARCEARMLWRDATVVSKLNKFSKTVNRVSG